MCLLPNSGGLNPIETIWAKLRKDLASREFEDLKADRVISKATFKSRAAKFLTSYGIAGPGGQHSYLEKLVKGMLPSQQWGSEPLGGALGVFDLNTHPNKPPLRVLTL